MLAATLYPAGYGNATVGHSARFFTVVFLQTSPVTRGILPVASGIELWTYKYDRRPSVRVASRSWKRDGADLCHQLEQSTLAGDDFRRSNRALPLSLIHISPR